MKNSNKLAVWNLAVLIITFRDVLHYARHRPRGGCCDGAGDPTPASDIVTGTGYFGVSSPSTPSEGFARPPRSSKWPVHEDDCLPFLHLLQFWVRITLILRTSGIVGALWSLHRQKKPTTEKSPIPINNSILPDTHYYLKSCVDKLFFIGYSYVFNQSRSSVPVWSETGRERLDAFIDDWLDKLITVNTFSFWNHKLQEFMFTKHKHKHLNINIS